MMKITSWRTVSKYLLWAKKYSCSTNSVDKSRLIYFSHIFSEFVVWIFYGVDFDPKDNGRDNIHNIARYHVHSKNVVMIPALKIRANSIQHPKMFGTYFPDENSAEGFWRRVFHSSPANEKRNLFYEISIAN